jgi:hypothetical protein
VTTTGPIAATPASLPPVLLVEDDPVSRRLLEATLRRWGREVLVTVAHSLAQFGHGVCPQCYESIVEPQIRAPRVGRSEPA